MKTLLVAAVLFAGAMSAPVEDTPAVKEAKASFLASYDEATAGKHARLAPAPVAASYIPDSVEVSNAKREFQAIFKNAEEAASSSSEPAERPVVPIAIPYAAYPQGFAYSTLSPALAPLIYHQPLPLLYGGYLHHPAAYIHPYAPLTYHNGLPTHSKDEMMH